MGDVLTSFVQDFQGERPRTNYSGDGSSSPIGRLVSINSSKVKGLIYDSGSSNDAAVPVSALRIGGIVKVTTPVGCMIGAGVRLVGGAVTAQINTMVKQSASAGATAFHMAWVRGLPCRSRSGGPVPP